MPYGRLLSAIEAQQHLGIPASTVRTWQQRQKFTGLYAVGFDRLRRRPLFYEADLLVLKMRMRVRDIEGHRHYTMADVQQLRSRHRGNGTGIDTGTTD